MVDLSLKDIRISTDTAIWLLGQSDWDFPPADGVMRAVPGGYHIGFEISRMRVNVDQESPVAYLKRTVKLRAVQRWNKKRRRRR